MDNSLNLNEKFRIKVYIASPYTNGNREDNANLQIDAAYYLLKLGFNPYAPLLNHFIVKKHPDIHDKVDWVKFDKEWLAQCDIAVRIHSKDKDGNEIPSPGSDEEERFCKENGILMLHFNSLDDLKEKMREFHTYLK